MDVLLAGRGPLSGASSHPGQNPDRVLRGGALVDLGLQAPGQWLVTFLISTKGGAGWPLGNASLVESFTGNDPGVRLHFLQGLCL